uniref:DUF4371 domain-containing protein n=2 Tax=Nothobranchius furzeri TaxID=105023 RepID=A0A8C6VXB7_NOTFU
RPQPALLQSGLVSCAVVSDSIESESQNAKLTGKIGDAKPLCLLCHESLSVLKEYNIQRHHTEKHQTFGAQFPKGTSERASKVQSLLASYNRSSSTIVRACTAQEKATAASLRVSLILAKKKRPFTDSETVEERMLAVLDEVISDEKIKTSVTAAVKSVPLSDTSNVRRVEILAMDLFDSLIKDLNKAPVMSIAVDESTDRSDTAQLCVYVRLFDSDCARFREELLCLLPLKGHTTGEVFFDKISTFFQNNGLDRTRVCLLVTDGAPSMAGRINGLAARWSAVAPGMKSLHCIVHQAVLCAKLSRHFKTVMDNVMATINFIRATSSLQHRLFRQLLSDISAEHNGLLQHNDVRWLSKRNSLECFWELMVEIEIFMSDVCFLSDLFKHLNQLNLGLQGRDKTVIELVEQTSAFQAKLNIFTADLTGERMLHFPTLRKATSPPKVTAEMTGLVAKLKDSFASRLEDLSLTTEAMQLMKDPFAAIAEETSIKAKEVVSSIDEGQFLLEMYLSMFGSTYICESSFSHMNAIKTNLRSSLSESFLHYCLHIALSSYEPTFHFLFKTKSATSHTKVARITVELCLLLMFI